MVHLKNIVYENGIIKCLYSPEDSGEYGKLAYDVENDEYISLEQTNYENGKKFYVRNVKNKLKELAKQKEINSEYKLVIY